MPKLASIFTNKIHSFRLFSAIEDNDLDRVIGILNKHPNLLEHRRSKADNSTPLMIAATYGRPEIAYELLQRGAMVDATGYRARTALLYAVWHQTPIMPRERTDGHRETLKLLLKYNANINHVDDAGKMALDRCIDTKNIEFAKFLITHGANVEHQNAQGETVLMRAAYSLSAPMVALLIAHDAKIDTVDKNGQNASDLVTQRNSFLKGQQDAVIVTLNDGAEAQRARANYLRDKSIQQTSFEGMTVKPVLQKPIRLKRAP